MPQITMDPTHYREMVWEKFGEITDYLEAVKFSNEVYLSGDQETADEINLQIRDNKKNGYYGPDTAKKDGYAEHQSSTI